MKRILSLVLAGVMCLSLPVVSFAVTTKYTVLDFFMGAESNLMDSGYLLEDGKVSSTPIAGHATPGDVIYVPVSVYQNESSPVDQTQANKITKTSALNDYKLSFRVNDSERLINSMEWVSKKNTHNKTGLYLAVSLRDKPITEDAAVDATVTITPKSPNQTIGTQTGAAQFNVLLTVGYPELETDGGYEYVEASGVVLREMSRDSEELTLCFQKDVEVTGNFGGLKDTIFKMSTADIRLESKYPDTELRLFDFGSANINTLKRPVQLTIPFDVDAPYLYQITDNGLKELYAKNKGTASYENGAFILSASKLGNYILSEEPLSVTNSDDPRETPPALPNPDDVTKVPNPDTGASDFAGLAIALAVVSIAGIAVAVKK